MIKGYARISSDSQNEARQIESLKAAGCTTIYIDKISGATTERPELQKMLQELEQDDVVIVHDLDRLARSTVDLLQLIETIRSKNASLRSVNDKWLDTTTGNPFSDLLITFFSGLSEYERKMIKQRQKEGVAEAKKAGKYTGRVRKYTDKHAGMKHAIELFKEGNKTVKEICEITKVSRSALYRELQIQGIQR
jgi:DNA invertase Pin-like site-specific DNA recombinase